MTDFIGCTDGGCVFAVLRAPGGMGTNGGCKCFSELESWNEAAGCWNRDEVRQVRRWTQALVMQLREHKAKREEFASELRSARLKVSELMQRENRLRHRIAVGPGACLYCELPADKMFGCASGFPGCGRADDMVALPEDKL